MNFLSRYKLKSLMKKAKALYDNRLGNNVPEAEVQREISLYLTIAKFYDRHRYDKGLPDAEKLALENYRAAAALNDSEAQYTVGKRQLTNARFWDKMQKSIYQAKVHSEYALTSYSEAHAYLKAAEEQNHIQAKRLHGLTYVNAWGVEKNQDLGLHMIVDSINQENAWDKASEIFKELGLNKPEIFASITSMRNQSTHASSE